MPSDELRDAYIAVERLIMKVIKGSDDPMHRTRGTKT
jgi:hypothetical protein